MPIGCAIASDEFDSGHKECVVSERAKKLRCHDRIKTEFHVMLTIFEWFTKNLQSVYSMLASCQNA